MVAGGRRHCLLLPEVVQVSFLLPYSCPSGQGKFEWVALWGKARKEFCFGMPPAGSRWTLAFMEVAEVPGRRPGSETWFGCGATLFAPVSRNKCSVPGQRTRVVPSLWDSFEELAGCLGCWHTLSLTSLGVSQHSCSRRAPEKWGAAAVTLHVHMGRSMCAYRSSLWENSRAKL